MIFCTILKIKLKLGSMESLEGKYVVTTQLHGMSVAVTGDIPHHMQTCMRKQILER